MRKRQWKKILSLVLALAMVFTMNTSVFAAANTEVSAPGAESAAQPEDTTAPAEAQTPAAEPAAEEPAAAPVEESTPAEEPAKEETPAAEPAAGATDFNFAHDGTLSTTFGTKNKWTLTLTDADDATAEGNYDGDVLNVTSVTGTLTLTADEGASSLTLNESDGVSVALGTGLFAVDGDKKGYSATKTITGKNGCTVMLVGSSGIDALTNDDSAASVPALKSDKDIYAVAANGDSCVTLPITESVTAGTYVCYDSTGKTVNPVNAVSVWEKEEIATDAQNTAKWSDDGTKLELAGAYNYDYLVLASDAAEDEHARTVTKQNTLVENVAEVSGLDNTKSYKVYYQKKNGTDKYSSDWTVIATVAAYEEPEEEGTMTVSGYVFSWDKDDEKISVTSENKANGTATVKIEGGEVSVAWENNNGASKKALSINVAEGATLIFDKNANDKTIKKYDHLTLEGAGTVYLNYMDTSAAVYPYAFEDVDSNLSISGNGANLLISANNAGTPEYLVVLMTDTAVKTKGGKLVAVNVKENKNPNVDKTNTIFTTSSGFKLLSGNKTSFTTVDDENVLVASDNRIEGVSVEFGEELIYVNDENKLGGAGVLTVPQKGVSKWKQRFVTGMATSDGIYPAYDTEQKKIVGQYEFILSTNSAAEKEAAEDTTNWRTGGDDIKITKLVKDGIAESGKTYYLYARKLPTATEYKSDVVKVCEFKTLNKVTISLNLANPSLSPNYIGDATTDEELKALADKTNVINMNFFKFVPHNFDGNVTFVDNGELDNYNDNKYTVLDADGFALGYVTIIYGKYNTTNPVDIDWSTYASTSYNNLEVNNLANPYAAYVTFKSVESAQTIYNDQTEVNDSGIVSFNVVKAPVKVEPNIFSPAVSGQSITTKYKVTSKVTGKQVTLGGAPLYLLDGKRTDEASWNEAGKSSIPAGKHTVTVSAEGLTINANYEFDSKKNSDVEYGSQELLVVDPDGSDGLKVTGKQVADVYYGTTIAGIKAALSADFTFGGVNVTVINGVNIGQSDDVQDSLYILKSPSENAQKATDRITTDAEMAKVSANTTVYAYYVDALVTLNGKELTASSNVVEIKIQPRKVYVERNDGKTFKTKRGLDVTDHISANLLQVYVVEDGYEYKATELPNPAGVAGDKFFAGKDIALNTTGVNKNKPGEYSVMLKDYTVSSDYAQNYTVDYDVFNYTVDGRYWVKYILEYGGKGAKTGKRYVSQDIIDVDDVDFGTTKYNITPSSKLSNSWNGVLPEGDVITKWEIKKGDTLENLSSIAYGGTYAATLNDYDFAVYAVVSAKATEEGVMVESITPVTYTGMPHVARGDGSTSKRANLTVTLYDKNKTIALDPAEDEPSGYKYLETKDGKKVYAYQLVKGTDYTLSYKNNVNASVAYDETVSDDNTFKRIVTDAKMPQVIVKGKNNYKSLKTTVLFDILPIGFDADGTEALKYQQAGKNLNTKATVTAELDKKLNSTGSRAVDLKTYKLKAGKYNEKKGTYTGDYIMNVYKIADNGAKTLLGEAKDLKKIPAGTYQLEFKGVNNYRGVETVDINVKNWTLLSQQKFKWTKKVDWAEKITTDSFKIEVTNKKTKAAIPLVKYAEKDTKAGYYISSIVDNTRNKTVTDAPEWGEEWSEYNIANAGTYTIYLTASEKLKTDSDIAGTHSLKVEVKGTKLKPADFTIEGQKANKTVIIDYTGKSTDKPVALQSGKVQKNSESEALNAKTNTFNYGNARYWKDDTSYKDSGATYAATLTGKGVYTVSPTANNSSIYETYEITIVPSGKYYGPNSDGSVTLTYKRGNIDLKKAVGSLVKVTEVPVEVNIGGTSADLRMEIAGMTPVKNSTAYSTYVSGDKIYMAPYTDSVGKQHIKFNGYDIFDIAYSSNKKVGKGKATLKPTKYGKSFFKGSATVEYTIKQRTVNEVLSINTADVKAGDIVAEVVDTVAPKSGSPKVNATLYQVAEFGGKLVKLNKKDATVAAGTEVKDKGFPIVVTAGNSGNFKFENAKKEAKVEASDTYFNVFGKKTTVKVTLSQPSTGDVVYDAAQKGYVYTGNKVDPLITSIEIDKKVYSFPAGLSASSNFTVKYENDVKVGNATATITLKRNPALSANVAYPFGGSVKVKYKIVPHKNTNLVLNK